MQVGSFTVGRLRETIEQMVLTWSLSHVTCGVSYEAPKWIFGGLCHGVPLGGSETYPLTH